MNTPMFEIFNFAQKRVESVPGQGPLLTIDSYKEPLVGTLKPGSYIRTGSGKHDIWGIKTIQLKHRNWSKFPIYLISCTGQLVCAKDRTEVSV